VSFDINLLIDALPELMRGAWMTIRLTVIAVGMGIIIGTFMGMARLSKHKLIHIIAAVYVDVIRGTPLLVQIAIVYFGFPQLFGFRADDDYRYLAAIIALSVNSGAYVAEIVRAGIQSIDRGQMEAARSLGMSHVQAMRFIILPQAFKRIIPPLGNEFIAMLKDSSLVSTIAVTDLFRTGQYIVARNFAFMEIYLGIAIIYLVLTFSISRLVDYAERRLKVSD